MILLKLIFACAWNQVLGQYNDGIVFTINNKPAPPPNIAPPSLVLGNKCKCVIIGTCPTPAPLIDFRIVNNGDKLTCPLGFVVCCSVPPPAPPEPKCGVRRIEPTSAPVIGQASFGAYPWHAALLTLSETFIGSGVLLDSKHVLTAAHKVSSFVKDPGSLQIRLGEWNAFEKTEPYEYLELAAMKITIHPQYNSKNLENDVAVIKLNKAVPIISYPNINTACMPSAPVEPGTRCYVTGWGKHLFGPNGSYQNIMREVDVPILDESDCEARLRQTRLGRNYYLNGLSFMCAGGEPGKDACEGDGGAPLVCQNENGQWTVYGLVAWGIGCASLNVPGVYTNVFNFLPWIKKAMTED